MSHIDKKPGFRILKPEDCFNQLVDKHSQNWLEETKNQSTCIGSDIKVLPPNLASALEMAIVAHIVKRNIKKSKSPEEYKKAASVHINKNFVPHEWMYRPIIASERYPNGVDYLTLCEDLSKNKSIETLTPDEFETLTNHFTYSVIADKDPHTGKIGFDTEGLEDQKNLLLLSIPDNFEYATSKYIKHNSSIGKLLKTVLQVHFAYGNTLLNAFIDPKHPNHNSAKQYLILLGHYKQPQDPDMGLAEVWGTASYTRELFSQGTQQFTMLKTAYEAPYKFNLPPYILSAKNTIRVFTSENLNQLPDYLPQSDKSKTSGKDLKDKLIWLTGKSGDYLLLEELSPDFETNIPQIYSFSQIVRSAHFEFVDENIVRLEFNKLFQDFSLSFSVFFDVSQEKILPMPLLLDEENVLPETNEWLRNLLLGLVDECLNYEENENNRRYLHPEETVSKTSDPKTLNQPPSKPNIPKKWLRKANKNAVAEKIEAAQLRRLPLQVPETIESQIRTDFGKSGDEVRRIVADKIRIYLEGGGNLEKHAHKTLNVENMYKIRAGAYRIIIEKKSDDQGNSYLEVVQVTQGNTGDYHREFH